MFANIQRKMVTADEARQLRSKKGTINHETYKMIYGKIQNKIQLSASKGKTSIEYVVPPFLPGRPMFSVDHAVRYNRDKLRYNGFTVDVVDDVLLIDWKPPPGQQHKPIPVIPKQQPIELPNKQPKEQPKIKQMSNTLKNLKQKLGLL